MRLGLIVALNGLRWRLTQSLTEQIGRESVGLKEKARRSGFRRSLGQRSSGLCQQTFAAKYARFRTGAHIVDFRLPHGHGRRIQLLLSPLAYGHVPAAGLAVSDQKIAAGAAMAFVGLT